MADSMKVVLPDNSELELPDGASGLDAARAIGPKLAEQAVLVRANGRVQDLRLPLEDGEPIQILTVRDKDDPDALAVLRHSSAHLLAEAVTQLYPDVKLAIGETRDISDAGLSFVRAHANASATSEKLDVFEERAAPSFQT